jgi:predicted O-linked N-acetylglucosamine transferase (SPINDLY family)
LLDRASYLRLVATVDVLLDPFHFGGGNTSYEAFAAGIPLVTLPSRFLRGRITSALYAMMGFDDLIAATSEDYVRLAVELGTDPDRRMACQKQILSLNQPLFDNAKGAQQLGEFLIRSVRATSQA